MEPYGVVVMDVPMEYNTSEYSQIPFADQGYDKEVCGTIWASLRVSNQSPRLQRLARKLKFHL